MHVPHAPVNTDGVQVLNERAGGGGVPDEGGMFRALHALAVATAGVLDPVGLARRVAEHTRALLGLDGVVLRVWDERLGQLVPLYTSDSREAAHDPALLPGEGTSGRAFLLREPVVVQDYSVWEHALPRLLKQGNHSAVAVPLLANGRVIGVLAARSYTLGVITPAHVRVMELLAAQVAPALDSARQHARAERAEAEVREGAARLQLALESAHLGTWDWDIASDTTVWSAEMEALHGVAPGAFTGRWAEFAHLVHPDDRAAVEREVQRALEGGGDYRLENRVVWPDGTVRWLLSRGRVFRDAEGRPARMLGTTLDVTDRRRAEAELRELAESVSTRTGAAFFASLAGFLARALGVRYSLVGELEGPGKDRVRAVAFAAGGENAGGFVYRLAGTPCEQVVRGTLCAYPSGVQERFPDDDWLAERGVEGYVGVRLDDSLGAPVGVLVALHTGPIRDVPRAESLLRIVARRAEAELERLRLDAERERLYAAEHTARAEAEAAVQVRDQVLAAVSHDLKSPLSTLRLRAEMLRLEVESVPSTPVAVVEELGKIEATAVRMSRLLDELVDTARLQAGHALDLDRRSTDLVPLVGGILVEQGELMRAEGGLRVETREPALLGVWDAARLERVVTNLLENARKYSPAGGEVVVTLAREGGWAVLTVRDQGIGIPAADLPHIFEPFRRGANASDGFAGSGVGLASAKHIVEQHGGSISLESTEGVGTTVAVRLPLAPRCISLHAQDRPEPTQGTVDVAGRSGTIGGPEGRDARVCTSAGGGR